MTSPVRVDIWSDIACPWCYIGKRRFETSVAEFVAGGGDVILAALRQASDGSETSGV
jgi:predicted DsbA family dithiol-disulfide isomerase